MLGIVGFEHLCIRCQIGCEEVEQRQEQDIFVDLQVEIDFARGVQTDSIEDTLSYVLLAEICTEIAKSKHHHLLETYAHAVVQRVLKEDKVNWAWIRVKKPGALSDARYAVAELKGKRS